MWPALYVCIADACMLPALQALAALTAALPVQSNWGLKLEQGTLVSNP